MDEWKLTKQQPIPVTFNVIVKPPFPDHEDVIWNATAGFNLTKIPVNTPVGTVVGKVSLHDYIQDGKTSVVFSTTSPSVQDYFKINANGDVVVQKKLDSGITFEKDVKVQLDDSELDIFSAQSEKQKKLTAPSNLRIIVETTLSTTFSQVEDEEHNLLDFREGEANVAENAILGNLISSNHKADVRYVISGINSDYFDVLMNEDQVNAKLIAKKAVPAGTYNLSIRASDGNSSADVSVSFIVKEPFKDISDFTFTQTPNLRIGDANVEIGKTAGSMSARGEGTLSYALTTSNSDNAFFKMDGESLKIDGTLVAKTYNLEVEISDAGSGKKKTESFKVVVAGEFPAINDLHVVADGALDYKSIYTTTGKRLGKLVTTGGTSNYTYAFKSDPDTGAQNNSFEIRGDELWVGGSDLVAGSHKINVVVSDANQQKLEKALIIKVNPIDQTFQIKNDNSIGIALSNTSMNLVLDNGLVSSAATTYDIRDGKDSVVRISGNTITFLTAGTFSVVASNQGDTNFHPYTTEKTFTISKSSITLQAKGKEILLGEAIPNNELMVVSGSVYNDDVSILGTPTFTYFDADNNKVLPTDLKRIGNYKIVPSLSENAINKQYDITYSDAGTFTISQDTLDESYYRIAPAKNQAGWYSGDSINSVVTITPTNFKGYTKISSDGGLTYSASNVITVRDEKINELQLVMKKDSGAITSTKAETIKLDISAPEVPIITFANTPTNPLRSLLRTMSFQHIFKEDQRISFASTDSGGSELDSFVYVLKTYDENGEEISTTDEVVVNASEPYVDVVSSNRYSIDVFAVDKAGNASAKASETLLLDKGDISLTMSALSNHVAYDGTTWTSNDVEVQLGSSGSLGETTYFVSKDHEAYTKVSQNPFIINQDQNDVTYRFKAVSQSGKESLEKQLQVKRDSVTPAFRVDTTVNGVPYIDGSATSEDILFTFVKSTGNVNHAPVTYYYATRDIGIDESGWTPIANYEHIKLIDYNTSDTFYFKCVSEAGLSSNRIDGPSLLRYKAGESLITVEKTLNGNSGKPYDGSWTKEDVVFTLHGGIDDLTQIDTYQYTTTSGSDEVSSSAIWKDMSELGSGSLVKNQLRIHSDIQANYYFRVKVIGTQEVYSTTDKHLVQVDKTAPVAPSITYTTRTRSAIEQFINVISFDQVFSNNQEVRFASTDQESGLKNFTYVLKKLDAYGNVISEEPEKTVSLQDPSFILDENSRYELVVNAVDVAGNESSPTVKKLLLDTSDPSMSVRANLGSPNGLRYDGSGWTAQDIYLSFESDAQLGVKKYQYKEENGEYQDVVEPMILNRDFNNVEFTFKAISQSGVESSETTLMVKRDSVKPSFDLETLAGDTPYISGSPTSEDITFTFHLQSGNSSGVSFYYATRILAVDDPGWIKINNYDTEMKITQSNADTYYFKAVSDAGVSSDIVNGPTLNVVKNEVTDMLVKKYVNGVVGQLYDGNYTKENVVFELEGGIADVSSIRSYQYTTTSGLAQPDANSVWIDMPEKSSDSVVNNQVSLNRTTALNYFFRVQVKDTNDTFATTTAHKVFIDKEAPAQVAISFAPLTRNGIQLFLNVLSFDHIFQEKQVVSFSTTDLGGSGLKEYVYVVSTLHEDGSVKETGVESSVLASSPSIQIVRNERYLIDVYAVDHAGNQSAHKTKKILVEDSDPSMQVHPTLASSSGSAYIEDTWTKEDIYVNLSSSMDLGAKEYQMKIGDEDYQRINNPFILQKDVDDVEYRFKAISQSGLESSEKSIRMKRDSVIPSFYVEASSNNLPYLEDTPSNQDVLFTMNKNVGNVNLSKVSYYYATAPLDVQDPGWILIDNFANTLRIDQSSQDTYYFKAVSEAGASSIVMKSVKVNITKEEATNIEITRMINGDPALSYTGNWTNQNVVISLSGGMVDPSMIKTYQYCEMKPGEIPNAQTIWYDMPEQTGGFKVNNTLSLTTSKHADYYFRLRSTGVGNAYAQTGKSTVLIDKENPQTPSMEYSPGIEIGEDDDAYHKSFGEDQTVNFSGRDVGGSELKEYRYIIETLDTKQNVLSKSDEIRVSALEPSLQVTLGKLYRLRVYSVDQAGNRSDCLVHLIDMFGVNRIDKVEDEDSGIIVEGKDDTTFDKDTTVEVKLVTKEVEESDLGKLNERLVDLAKLPKGSEIKEIYEIKLLLNGVEIQSPGRVKVKIPLTVELLALENRRVVYIDDERKITLISSYEDGEHIIFETDHFSQYAITGKRNIDSDLNYDSDGDGYPDINIDIDDDGIADLNIDLDGNKRPEVNIDSDGDGIADYNIDLDLPLDGIPDVNIGPVKMPWESDYCKKIKNMTYCSSSYYRPYLNIDTDNDGRPDVNVDLDKDMEADINIDVDGDFIPDVNIDSRGEREGSPPDGKADLNIDEDNDGVSDQTPTYIRKWTPDKDVDGLIRYDTMENIKGDQGNNEDDGKEEVPGPDEGQSGTSSPQDPVVLPSQNGNVQDVYQQNGMGGASTGDTTNMAFWKCICLVLMSIGAMLYVRHKRT